MKVTDWKNITISAKEFLTGVIFVFTLSGIYYKLYYEQAANKQKSDTEIAALKDEIQKLRDQVNTNTSGIKDLHEDKIARDALDKARTSQGYQPMTRIK